jgi:hypothetical protein
MNRIVREHYPVEKLPEDLREGIPAGEQVKVIVEPERVAFEDSPLLQDLPRPERVLTLEEMFAMRRPVYSSVEETVAHVRALRDEWE